jgi:polyisoprenoid-binding protein YceI
MTTDIGAAVTVGTYAIDTDRSRIRFTATHAFGLGPVTGTCAVRDGTITIASDPAGCAASARVDAASIATGNVRRDQAVQAKRFLDVREYPDMLFVSERVAGDGDCWVLHGTLTVRGVAAPVALELSSAGAEAGGCRFRARARIDRGAHGVGPRGVLGRYLEVEVDVAGRVVSPDAW